MNSIRLSIEEMAYLLGVLGGGVQAGQFLRTTIGEKDDKEIEGRLISAAHSLLARGWLILENNQQKKIDGEIQRVLEQMLGSSYSLRFSKIQKGKEDIVAYFFHDSKILEHRIDSGAVCCLEAMNSWDDYFQRSASFLEIPDTIQFLEKEESIILPADLLQSVKEEAEKCDGKSAAERLVKNHVPPSVANLLAEDMAIVNWRGSGLKTSPKGDKVDSEGGFLILKGQRRMWFFEIILPKQDHVRILPASKEGFRSLLQKLSG